MISKDIQSAALKIDMFSSAEEGQTSFAMKGMKKQPYIQGEVEKFSDLTLPLTNGDNCL